MAERMAKARVTIREIMAADDTALSAAHALLRREFHRAEMLPIADWRNAMREREEGLWTDIAWHLVVAEHRGSVIAAASGSYLGNLNIGLVGYIVVTADARSFGLGPRMRRALLRRFETDARRVRGSPLYAIVGEVREGNPWLRHLIRHSGAIALDFPYYQPSFAADGKPVPLVLYYQPLTRRRRSLSVQEVRRLLYSMWRRAYRIPMPMEHAEFRRMIRSLEGRKTVRARSLQTLRG